jgi:hypothetical protein
MLRDFSIKNIEEEVYPYNIAVARYDTPGYYGYADVVMWKIEHHGRELGWMFELWYASGSHCSCYGLEGQWEPMQVSLEQVKAWVDEDDYYNDDDSYKSALAEFIKHVESYTASPDGYPLAPVPEDEDA